MNPTDEEKKELLVHSSDLSDGLFALVEQSMIRMYALGMSERDVYASVMSAVAVFAAGNLAAMNDEENIDRAFRLMGKQIKRIINDYSDGSTKDGMRPN